MKSTTQPEPKPTQPRTRLRLTQLLLLAAVVLIGMATPAPAQHGERGGKRDLDVMTANLYVGGGIDRVMALSPSDPNYGAQLVGAVSGVFYEIVASQPEIRMHRLAAQIADRLPDVVALEEASLVRVQSPGDLLVGGTTPATAVVYDYVQILLKELKARGARHKVAVSADEMDVELPMLNLQSGQIDDARLTDRDVILVRADLPPGQLSVVRSQSGHFSNAILIPGLGLSVLRGWCSIDLFVRGRGVRCICTHLEEETAPQIQALQVQELLAGPAKTSLPVVLLGDFNADPLHRDGSFAYDLIPAAGFGDAWAALHRGHLTGGLTWGHDEYLANPALAFDRRIDLVFYRGKGLEPVRAQVTDLATGRLQPPLWASDHACVNAEFRFR